MIIKKVYVCELCESRFDREDTAHEHEVECLAYAKKGKPAITVWRFCDAPPELRGLSWHSGDEDWLAVVPPYLKDEWIPWLDTGSFGRCNVSKHEREDGSTVYIGTHA